MRHVWRGDRVPREREASVCEEGLSAVTPERPDPRYVTRAGLWQAVHAHVAPRGVTEQAFRDASCFLSFSESYEVACRYARTRVPGALHADGEKARTMIVRLDISERQEEEGAAGLHRLAFACANGGAACPACRERGSGHLLRLIDVPTYLEAHPELQARPDALACARRDREWLVLPLDVDPEAGTVVSRIPLAPIWNVEWVGVDRESASHGART